jgi:type IV pilus assembly protein PilC
MAEEVGGGRLQTFTSTVADELSRGRQLSEALERYSPDIPDYYIALVRAGEKAGSLAEVLYHVIHETRRQIDHRRAVITSLAYPTMTLLFAAAIIVFVGVVVVPEFRAAYNELGAELPEPTGSLFQLLENVGRHPLYYGATVATIVAALAAFGSGHVARGMRDAILLNMPIVGRMVFNNAAITFMRCTGFLLERGVAMAEALRLTESVMQNVVARQFVAQVREGVERGEPFSDLLDAYPYFPQSTRWILRLAEERGDLDQALLELADFHEVKQEHLREAFRGMLEPVLIILVGLLVGTLVVLLYMPLFEIPKLIK